MGECSGPGKAVAVAELGVRGCPRSCISLPVLTLCCFALCMFLCTVSVPRAVVSVPCLAFLSWVCSSSFSLFCPQPCFHVSVLQKMEGHETQT